MIIRQIAVRSAQWRSLAILPAALFSLAAQAPVEAKGPPPPPKPAPPPIEAPSQSSTQGTPPHLVLPSPNRNALIPTDQNYGYTGITLIERLELERMRAAKGHAAVLPKFQQGDGSVGNRVMDACPADARIIDTDGDEAGEHLLPIAYTVTGRPNVIHVGAHRTNVLLFTRDGEAVAGALAGGPDALVLGAAGSVYTTNDGVITLHAGRIVVDSGAQPVRIATKQVGVKLEPGGTIVFDYLQNDHARILTVGGIAITAKVRTSRSPDRVIELKPNEEFVFSSETEAVRTLNPADPAYTAEFAQLLPVSVQGKFRADYLRLLAHMAKASGNLPAVEPRRSGVAESLSGPIRILAKEGTEFIPDASDSIRLLGGELFVEGRSGTTINTSLGSIRCDKDSRLAVQYFQGYLRAETCNSDGRVWVQSGHFRISVDPGAEVLITDHYPYQGEALLKDGVGRRQFSVQELDGGRYITLADFSIFSLLRSADYLKCLRKPYAEEDKRMLDKLINTAAASERSGAGRGDYQYPAKQ